MNRESRLLPDPGCVSNDADDMSCLHACVQMVMRTRAGGRIFSFEEINRILRRKPGFYSWGYAVSAALAEEGFEVRSLTTFSTERFVRDKEQYLLERLGPEAGQIQIRNTDMPVVLEDAACFLASTNVRCEERVPTSDDIRSLLEDGWYLVPLVNFHLLNNQSGYEGHFIFLYGFDSDGVWAHDPGLPARPERHIRWPVFEAAWSSPRVETRSLGAYRFKERIENAQGDSDRWE